MSQQRPRPLSDEDLERIGEDRDRRFTFQLLDELGDLALTDARRSALVEVLSQLDDPRAVATLSAWLGDASAAPVLRRSASSVLTGMTTSTLSGAELRRLWHSGDTKLQRHAVLQMTQAEADLIEPVLKAPDHALHAEAVAALAFDFTAPRFSHYLIEALQHPRPSVRVAAARALVWSEPAAALLPLSRATADADEDVAVEAFDTLCYYPCLASVRAAHAQLDHPSERRRSAARNCCSHVREAFRDALMSSQCADSKRLRDWMEPVWDLLASTPEDLARSDRSRVPSSNVVPPAAAAPIPTSLDAFAARYGELDAPWAERERELRQADWSSVPGSERGALADWLLASSDPVLREFAPRVMATWRDGPRLRTLLRDPCSPIRKSDAYYAREAGPDPALAEALWSHLPSTFGTHAYETFESAIALTAPADWIPRAEALLMDPGQEPALRFSAVYALKEAGAAAILTQAMALLAEPPSPTWALHVALLDAARDLDLALPDLTHLADVDNLELQDGLAQI